MMETNTKVDPRSLEPRYEIGGHLVDAHGKRHLIINRVSDGHIQIEGDAAWIYTTQFHLFGGYEPPQKAITIAPGDELYARLDQLGKPGTIMQGVATSVMELWSAAKAKGGAK